MDSVGSYLSLTDIHSCLQVCQQWYRYLINSRPAWKSQCQQQGFITYAREEEHPRDKCKRMLLVMNTLSDHIQVRYMELEDVPITGKTKLMFSHEDATGFRTPQFCVGDDLFCVECPAGKIKNTRP